MAVPATTQPRDGVQPDAVPRVAPPVGARTPRRGPIDPRLVRRAGATRWYLAGGVLIGCLLAALTVGQAWVLSRAIAAVFAAAPGWEDTSPTPGTGLWPALGGAALALAAIFGGKALLGWVNAVLAHRTVASVKSQLRRDLVAARLARPLEPGASTAKLVTLTTVGLDALDEVDGEGSDGGLVGLDPLVQRAQRVALAQFGLEEDVERPLAGFGAGAVGGAFGHLRPDRGSRRRGCRP